MMSPVPIRDYHLKINVVVFASLSGVLISLGLAYNMIIFAAHYGVGEIGGLTFKRYLDKSKHLFFFVCALFMFTSLYLESRDYSRICLVFIRLFSF